MPILKAFDGDQETEDRVTATSPASLAYILMALSALALGLQARQAVQ